MRLGNWQGPTLTMGAYSFMTWLKMVPWVILCIVHIHHSNLSQLLWLKMLPWVFHGFWWLKSVPWDTHGKGDFLTIWSQFLAYPVHVDNVDEIGVSKIRQNTHVFFYSASCSTPPSLQLQIAHGQTFHPPLPTGWRFGGPPIPILLCLLIQPTTWRDRWTLAVTRRDVNF